jgi:hypothetical protein
VNPFFSVLCGGIAHNQPLADPVENLLRLNVYHNILPLSSPRLKFFFRVMRLARNPYCKRRAKLKNRIQRPQNHSIRAQTGNFGLLEVQFLRSDLEKFTKSGIFYW